MKALPVAAGGPAGPPAPLADGSGADVDLGFAGVSHHLRTGVPASTTSRTRP